MHPSTISSTLKRTEDSFWKFDFDDPVSPIEKSFDSNEIRRVVEYLVLSRYGYLNCNKSGKSPKKRANEFFKFPQNCSNSSSFDEAKFLRNALGEAVDARKILPLLTKHQGDDMTINSNNLSELISDYTRYMDSKSHLTCENYVNQYFSYNKNNMKSVSSLSTESNTSSGFTSDNSYKSTTITQENSIYESIDPILESTEDSSLESLHQELFVANQNKQQLLKAVNSDSVSHKRGFSSERLEAEKLLLIADIKNRILIKEIDEFSSDQHNNNNNPLGTGSVKISDIHMYAHKSNIFDEYFVCLLIYGSKVQATEISRIKSSGIVIFKNHLEINQLPTSCKTCIKIFSIPSKKVKKFNSLMCLQHEPEIPKNCDSAARSSLFKLCDEIEFNISDKRGFDPRQNQKRISVSVSVKANFNFELRWDS